MEAIPLSKSGQRRYEADPNFPGLKLRISDSSKAWYVVSWSRHHQRVIRVKLGGWPKLGLADAREDASHVLTAIERGLDPNAVRRREQAEAAVARIAEEDNGSGRVVEDFLARGGVGDTWRREQKRLLERHVLPEWGSRPLASITRADVRDLVERVARHAPTEGNRLLATLKKLFSWALEHELVDAHPAASMKPSTEKSRERVLSDAELRELWRACDSSYPFGSLLQFSLATAARRGECAGAKWSDIDLEEKLWTIPRSKGGHAHEIPLSPLAVELLKACPHVGDHVFATTEHEKVSGFGHAVAAIKKQIAVENWRPHDLRRSAATGMARLGVAKESIRRVLGHVESDITAVYVRHGWLAEKRKALEIWSRHLRRAVVAK